MCCIMLTVITTYFQVPIVSHGIGLTDHTHKAHSVTTNNMEYGGTALGSNIIAGRQIEFQKCLSVTERNENPPSWYETILPSG
jgi:hypothetical protein